MAAWEFGSGNRSNYDLYITESYFATDAAYQSGEAILLQLIGHDEDGNEAKEIFSVGKDWTSTDGGKTIESTKGSGAKINQGSMYARFCQSAIKCTPDGLLAKRGTEKESSVWAGLIFHMDEVEQHFGKDIQPQWRNMPVAYKGMIDNQPSAADKVAAVKQAAASAAKIKEITSNGHVPDLAESLATLAKSSPDHESFVNAAVEIPELTADDEMLTLVADPSETGFYAMNK